MMKNLGTLLYIILLRKTYTRKNAVNKIAITTKENREEGQGVKPIPSPKKNNCPKKPRENTTSRKVGRKK
jgi:hypothetical protein